jgi:hypothetical protein
MLKRSRTEKTIHEAFQPGPSFLEIRAHQEYMHPRVPKGIFLVAYANASQVLSCHEDVLVDILKQWEAYRTAKTMRAMGDPLLYANCPVKKMFAYRIFHVPKPLLAGRNFGLDYEKVRELIETAALYTITTTGYMQVTKQDMELLLVTGPWDAKNWNMLQRLAVGATIEKELLPGTFLGPFYNHNIKRIAKFLGEWWGVWSYAHTVAVRKDTVAGLAFLNADCCCLQVGVRCNCIFTDAWRQELLDIITTTHIINQNPTEEEMRKGKRVAEA